MVEFLAHKVQFEPLVQIDMNVVPVEPGVPKARWRAYRVVWLEPIPMIVKDHGSLTAAAPGNVLADREFTELRLPDNELGHWRIAPHPKDDIKVAYKQPKTVGRFTTVEVMVEVGLEIWMLNPTLSSVEIFTLGRGVPFLTITNATSYDQPTSRVIAQGYRLQLEPLPELPAQYVPIPVVGKPARA